MRRITQNWLESRVSSLNMILERPMCIWNSGAAGNEQNVGHIRLDKNSTGYKLVEITSPAGGECVWSPRLDAKHMDQYIDGIVKGIALRNAHIGAVLLKNKVEDAGLTPNTALYSDSNAKLLQYTEPAGSATASIHDDSDQSYQESADEPNEESVCNHSFKFLYPGSAKYDVYKCTACGQQDTRSW
jgi:hypothetical protein